MSLQTRIDNDYKSAFKRQQSAAVEAFRMLKSAVKNAEIEARHELSDEETMAVIKKEVKRRRDSIAQFAAAGRQDLVDRETAQLAILTPYLPEQMDLAALTAVVTATIAEMKATPADFGKVMAAVMAKVKNQAEGSAVSTLVKEHLT